VGDLANRAVEARERAVAPFSGFKVGAALEAADGTTYTGCNIENATFSLTVCAERVAVWKALSEGAKNFVKIVVVADSDTLTPPCGSCRQVLWEFCGNLEVVLMNLKGETRTLKMADLFPDPFDMKFFASKTEGKRNTP